ncbi:hypothetical protein UFOVP787_93 [uncultured Caudovirales phage]|uniref:Uncharacterized protein n=1 Tax=uncultured Caudovirales phage TaxID=2100421 RepID=A0A6J5NZW2_9CAUD|nr:hypothetical protein UFOVP787_93 [uncultured Caudovirales phage]
MDEIEFRKDLRVRVFYLASVTSVEKTVDFINLLKYALTKSEAEEINYGSQDNFETAQAENCSSDEKRTVSGESEVSGS